MSTAAPLPRSRRTPVTPGGRGSIRVEYVLDSVDDDYRDVLIVKFIGTYAIGSAGSPDATYMQAMVRAGEMCFHPSAIVLDLSELSYQWGDDLEAVFGPDCPHAVAVRAVVVGPPSREAIGTLLFGVESTTPATEREGIFEDVDAAVAYVRRRIGEPRYRPPPNGEPLTEAQWLESGEPYDMWEWLVYDVPNRRWSMHDWPRTDRATDRKLLLFAVACCRRMWHLMDGRSRGAVEAAERAADAGAPNAQADADSEASAAYRDALAAYDAAGQRRESPEASSLATATAAAWVHSPLHSITVAQECTSAAGDALQVHAEGVAQTHLLRDIFGNPFRPLPDVTPLRTEEVVTLARRMYDSRRFDRMPELAAALRHAGCDDAAILAHCTGDRPHVRGCWVVDLLLGKR